MWMAAQRRECPNAANIHLIVQMVTFMLRTFYHTGGGGGVCVKHTCACAHTHTQKLRGSRPRCSENTVLEDGGSQFQNTHSQGIPRKIGGELRAAHF